jgi:hypothetical protein
MKAEMLLHIETVLPQETYCGLLHWTNLSLILMVVLYFNLPEEIKEMFPVSLVSLC